MSGIEYGFEAVDHTADLAITAYGELLPDVFRYCAMGMFDQIVGIDSIELKMGERIEVKGHDLEDILIRMLSELLFRFNTRHQIFADFIIEYLTHEKLVFYARGETIDSEKHQIKTEIKAATYHDLLISPEEEGYRVTVVFDL